MFKKILFPTRLEEYSLASSHANGFVSETLWGSVSQRVAEYREKPVLVVK